MRQAKLQEKNSGMSQFCQWCHTEHITKNRRWDPYWTCNRSYGRNMRKIWGAPGRIESHGKELQDSSTSNWVAPEWTTHNSVWILSGTQKIMNQIRSKVLNRVEITLKPRRKVNDKNFQGIPFSSRHPERHEAGKLGVRYWTQWLWSKILGPVRL